jgi:hypothetical protein
MRDKLVGAQRRSMIRQAATFSGSALAGWRAAMDQVPPELKGKAAFAEPDPWHSSRHSTRIFEAALRFAESWPASSQ